MSPKFTDPEIQGEYNKFRFERLQYLKTRGGKLHYIFNNFNLVLPGSSHRDFWRKSDKFDIPQGKAFEHLSLERGNTELYMNQSRREFYEIIDRVLREEGVYEEVEKTNKKIDRFGVYLLAASSWFKLREMGYSQRDLF